jgi:hypothetical protein
MCARECLLHYGLRNCRRCYPLYKCIKVSIVAIRKQSTLQEAEDPKPEPKEKPMPVSKLTEGLERIQVGLKVSEDTDSKERRRGTTKHWITRILACFEEITEGEQVFDSPEISIRMFVIFRDSCNATCMVGLRQ